MLVTLLLSSRQPTPKSGSKPPCPCQSSCHISQPLTCKTFAFPLWTTYDTLASPHPPHFPKPKIQSILIMLLPILFAPVLLLLFPVLFSSARALDHRLWGALSRIWSWRWDQVTPRRCPTQCSMVHLSLPVLLRHCRQCKALTCTLTWIPHASEATSKAEHTILDKKQLYKNHGETQQLCSVWCYCPLCRNSTFSRHISCSPTANKSSNNSSAPQQLGERAPLERILRGLSV